MVTIMRALLLATMIGALTGCVVDRNRGEGDYRGDRQGFDGEHRDRDFDRGGYNDFRSEGPHGLDHLDRPD